LSEKVLAALKVGPSTTELRELDLPPMPDDAALMKVEVAGVCGTDVEFFTGHMAYLHQGHATYPMRLGHEWCGAVSAVGDGVDPSWAGQRVTGDTMLGCGRCHRCRTGRQHVCEDRFEIGVRGGWPGARGPGCRGGQQGYGQQYRQQGDGQPVAA